MVLVSLLPQLHRFSRRLLAVGGGTGAGWGLAAAILVFINSAWLDLLWELPPELRLACDAAALGTLLFLIAVAVVIAVRRSAPHRLARRLDQFGQTAGQVLSGVDLALTPENRPPLTAGLAEMAIRHAGELVSRIHARQAVPATPLYWSLSSFGVLAVVVGLAGFAMPRLALTQWQRFLDPYGDHPPFSRVIFHVEPGDVELAYGSGLDIRVRTEGAAVERLDLVLRYEGVEGEERLPLFPEPEGAWRATVAHVTANGQYLLRSQTGRSRSFHIRVITVPYLDTVRFRIAAPAYTSRPLYEGPLPQGGLAGLPGTQVQVWAKSNRPLSSGWLEVSSPEGNVQSDLYPTGPDEQEVTGTFVIRKAGKLQLKVIDQAGQPSADTFTTPITLLTDERPFLRLLEPPPQSFATPTVALPVVLAAEDDYGISRVQLFRSLNDSQALPMDVPLKSPPPTRLSESLLLPLSAYGLQPGDEIKLYGRVEDNDPNGPKGSESTIAVVRIISQEDFERLVRVRQGMEVFLSKYRQAQRRLESLAEEAEQLRKKLRALKSTDLTGKDQRESLKQLSRRLQEEASALRQAAQKLLPYDLDKALSKHLEEKAQRLERLAREWDDLASRPKLTPEEAAEALQKMLDELAKEREQLDEHALQPLEQLASVLPLLEDASRFVILYQRQRALAERLASLRHRERTDDPALKVRMRDLQTEQEQIRTDLARLLDDLEDHLTQLPEDPALEELRDSATDFVQAVRGSGASEAMSDAEAGLAEFSGRRGHARAQKAADILEKFLARCQGGQGISGKGRKCLRFKPALAQGLGNTVEQLLAEAGLLPGMNPGQGEGGGSGYSARRNSLENVGLYGGLPGMDEAPGRASANQSKAAVSPGPRPRSGNKSLPSGAAAAVKSSAAGAADTRVPVRYRRRVAEYFQRVAEETGGK